MVSLTLKWVRNPHDHKKAKKILLVLQLRGSSDESAGGPLGDIISDGSGGVTAPGLKALALVEIFQGVTAVFGDNSWDRGICWEKLGGTLASDDEDDRDLTDTMGSSTSDADIWSGIMLVETDCRTGW